MASEPNRTCTFSEAPRPVGAAFKIYNLAFVGAALAILVPSILLWTKWRKLPYLKKRSFSLVLVMIIGYAMQLTSVVGYRVEEDFPCEVRSIAYLLCLPYVAFPSVVRLHLWVNRIRLNYEIAKSLALTGETAIHTTSSKFSWLRFRASRSYGLLLVALVLLPYSSVIFVGVSLYTCRACGGFGQLPYFSFLGICAMAILAVLRALYVTKDVPDLFGIRKESKVSYSLAFCFGIPGLVLSNYDVGGFEQMNPRNFSWGAFVDIAFFAFMFVTIPVQVYHAHRQHPNKVLDDPAALKEMLETDNGFRFFQMYLATELSLENLLFYQAVKEWKDQTSQQSITEKQSARLARAIYETYLTKTYFQVNVSSTVTSRLASRFESEAAKFPTSVFDEAKDQVFNLMVSSSFMRFRSSAFFQLYTGEISSEDVKWIESSGMSSYVFMAQQGAVRGRNADHLLPRKRILSILHKHADP